MYCFVLLPCTGDCTKGQHFTVAPTSPGPAALPSHLSLDDCLSGGWLSSQPKTVILAIVADVVLDRYRQIFVCFASGIIRTTDTIVEGSCQSATLDQISEKSWHELETMILILSLHTFDHIQSLNTSQSIVQCSDVNIQPRCSIQEHNCLWTKFGTYDEVLEMTKHSFQGESSALAIWLSHARTQLTEPPVWWNQACNKLTTTT